MSKTYTVDEVLTMLRRRVTEAGSLRKFAAKHGISSTHVSNVVSGKESSLGTAIPAALGLEKRETETLYVRVSK